MVDALTPTTVLNHADSLLVPAVAKDTSQRAIATLAARLDVLPVNPMLVYDIDAVDASVLPHLAWQFNVLGIKGWAFTRTEAEQRALLKRALELHRYKGTPWAVEEALRIWSVGGHVVEWFESGESGEPYTFRVEAEIENRGLSEDDWNAADGLIQAYKNVRSHLAELRIFLTSRGTVRLGSMLICGEVLSTDIWQQQDITASGRIRMACAVMGIEILTTEATNGA